MRAIISVLFLLLLLCFVYTAQASSRCDPNDYCNNWNEASQCTEWLTPSGDYGCKIGHIKGVDIYSNGADGDYTGTEYGNLGYQCVALIKRFYLRAMAVNLYRQIGVASNYYNRYGEGWNQTWQIDFSYLENSGLERIANDYSGTINVGDILVFSAPAGTGHVAVVGEVNFAENRIYFFEQNFREDIFKRSRDLLIQNGKHMIDDANILGWLHMPVGEFNDGWHFTYDIGSSPDYQGYSEPFTACYQNNGGRNTFGSVQGKVYSFPGYPNQESSPYDAMRTASVQDFDYAGYAYTIVVNEYVYNTYTELMGVAYPVGGEIRNYWRSNYWQLGYPVTNEYYYYEGGETYVVQWFERLDEDYNVVIYDTSKIFKNKIVKGGEIKNSSFKT